MLKELRASLNPNEIFLLNKNSLWGTSNVNERENDLYQLIEFKGSSGHLTLTHAECILWVDTRYKNAMELKYANTEVCIRSLDREIFIKEYLHQCVMGGLHTILCDFRKWSAKRLDEWRDKVEHSIWKSKSFKREVHKLERSMEVVTKEISGESSFQRLKWIQQHIDQHCLHFITNPEDISWILNLRAHDFPNAKSVRGKIILSGHYAAFFSDMNQSLKSIIERHCPGWIIVEHEEKWAPALKSVMRRNHKLKLQIDYHKRPGAISAEELQKVLTFVQKDRLVKQDRSLIERRRVVKNQMEIESMKRSGRKLSQVMREVKLWMHEQIEASKELTEGQLAKQIFEIAKSFGAEKECFSPIVASGFHSCFPHHTSLDTKVIKPGEMVLIDFGFYFSGEAYATDMARSFLAGRDLDALPVQKEMYTQVLTAFLHQYFCTFQEGDLKAWQLDKVGRDILLKNKEKQFEFSHSTGHGIGIQVHELAITIGPASKISLQEGYAYSIEPGIYYDGDSQLPEEQRFGIRLEDMVVVEKGSEGCQHMSMTLHPFEDNLIDETMMDQDTINLYKAYQDQCKRIN